MSEKDAIAARLRAVLPDLRGGGRSGRARCSAPRGKTTAASDPDLLATFDNQIDQLGFLAPEGERPALAGRRVDLVARVVAELGTPRWLLR